MASFDTTLPVGISNVVANVNAINQPPVATVQTLVDDFPTNADPIPVAQPVHPRPSIGNRHRKFFSGVKNIGLGDDFFEDIYVLPVSIDAGIILSVLLFNVEVYSSYRTGTVQWTGYDDSAAGIGVDLISPNPPPPTISLTPLTSSQHSLQIDPVGPPSISADIEFDFLTPSLSMVQRTLFLQGKRSVIFPFQPEAPASEILEWETQVRTSSNGFEQRSALRDVPRSILQFEYLLEGDERRRLENLVFDGQSRAYGVPIWFEATSLTAPISINDTVITVGSTDFSRIVTDGLAIVWNDSGDFETLQVQSFTSTTITFSSPFTKAFSVGALVMPVEAAVLVDQVSQSRFRVNLQRNQFAFVVLDNGESIASTAAFNSYTPTNGTARVLLDDPNLMTSGEISEEFNKLIKVIDNTTAFPDVFSDQDVSREKSEKGFYTDTRSDLNDVRALLHALAGRRTSFYLPSFFPDLEPLAAVASADQAVTVVDVDYVNLVAQKQPRNVIRIIGTDGTTSDPKLVTGSSKPTPGQELISFTPDTAGVTIALADIERIEYIKKTRIDTDRIEIRHLDANGKAIISFPVITVLEPD